MKPIDQFGGWLRFFQVTEVIRIIVAFLMFWIWFHEVSAGKIANPWGFGSITTLVIQLVGVIISSIILWFLSQRAPQTPTRIAKLVIASAAVFIGGKILIGIIEQLPTQKVSIGLFPSAVIAILWLEYFKSSKRVRGYYGRNAFQKNEPQLAA